MSEQDLEVLKEFQNREKSDRLCCVCGKAICKGKENTTAYCSLCTFIKRHNLEDKRKPPLKTDAGFYILFSSNMCLGHAKAKRYKAYYNIKHDYIFINLNSMTINGEFSIPYLVSIISHEHMHLLLRRAGEGEASQGIDSKWFHGLMDEYM